MNDLSSFSLDKEQHQAATTTAARVVVTACPGSGKTRTVAARFTHMVENMGIMPSSIVLLTFTRYGANEMKSRIGSKARDAFIGTFHAFCLKLIKEYGEVLGWEYSWMSVLDEAEMEMEEDASLMAMGLKSAKNSWTAKCSQKEWNRFKMTWGSDKSKPNCTWPRTHILMQDALLDIRNRLAAENCMTFDMMIDVVMELFSKPGAQDLMGRRFRHFIIDEGQDSDQSQYDFVNAFAPQTVFMVGDVDQSIFEWRGARPQLFLAAANQFTHYGLPNSYRFGIHLGCAANMLIRNNRDRLDTAINAIANNEGSLQVRQNMHPDALAGEIQEEIQKGTRPEQIAVLARRHATLDECARMLERRTIPNLRIGGVTSIEKTAEYRAILGYIRIGANPSDRRGLMAVSQIEGISTERLWELRAEASSKQEPIAKLAGVKAPAALDELAPYLQKKAPEMDFGQALDYLKELKWREGFDSEAEMVRHLAIGHQQDKVKQAGDAVTLCTIHAAKGLEWKTVFLIGMNAEYFPSRRSMADGFGEEERRLAYVGMTRAREKLFMVHNEDLLARNKAESPFLGEAMGLGQREMTFTPKVNKTQGERP